MKRIPVFLMALLVNICYSQVTVINTGSSESLFKISSIGENFLISGSKSFLGKCYGECDSIFPLVVPAFPNSNYVFSVARPDTNVLFMTASSSANLNLTFWKSSDGGFNWTKKFDTVNPSMYLGVTIFFDTLSGISFSDNYKSIKTFDGFKTYSFGAWSSWNLGGAAQICGDSTILVSEWTGFYVSKDRGNTWVYGQGVGTSNINFGCLNKDTLFSLTSGNSSSHFLFSLDGGKTWVSKGVNGNTSFSNEIPFAVFPKNNKEIYFPSRNTSTGFGVILKTTDLGQTWTRYVTPFKKNLYDMKFINDSTALVCGEGGLLFKWNTKTAVFTGLPENKMNELAVKVFPNPVSDKLFIFLDEQSLSVKTTITNVLGQTVYSGVLAGKDEIIDFEGLKAGIYFVNLQSTKAFRVIKILKK
ncbi:MAG: T9SS type A sorting domain-containing protein [bacterium]|nr:T9SS type A sorting domain-containing protein [bacterium]